MPSLTSRPVDTELASSPADEVARALLIARPPTIVNLAILALALVEAKIVFDAPEGARRKAIFDLASPWGQWFVGFANRNRRRAHYEQIERETYTALTRAARSMTAKKLVGSQRNMFPEWRIVAARELSRRGLGCHRSTRPTRTSTIRRGSAPRRRTPATAGSDEPGEPPPPAPWPAPAGDHLGQLILFPSPRVPALELAYAARDGSDTAARILMHRFEIPCVVWQVVA